MREWDVLQQRIQSVSDMEKKALEREAKRFVTRLRELRSGSDMNQEATPYDAYAPRPAQLV
jgi:hypothetical protein